MDQTGFGQTTGSSSGFSEIACRRPREAFLRVA